MWNIIWPQKETKLSNSVRPCLNIKTEKGWEVARW